MTAAGRRTERPNSVMRRLDVVAMSIDSIAEWSIDSCGSAGRVSAETLSDGAAELLPGSRVVLEHAPTHEHRGNQGEGQALASHQVSFPAAGAEAARSVDDRG